MKNKIGVICENIQDFNKYVKYYLNDIEIIKNNRTCIETNDEIFIAIYNRIGFTGIMIDYYLFSENAFNNKNLLEILNLTQIYTRRK